MHYRQLIFANLLYKIILNYMYLFSLKFLWKKPNKIRLFLMSNNDEPCIFLIYTFHFNTERNKQNRDEKRD